MTSCPLSDSDKLETENEIFQAKFLQRINDIEILFIDINKSNVYRLITIFRRKNNTKFYEISRNISTDVK